MSFDWDAFYAASTVTGAVELDTDQRWSTWTDTAHTLDRGPQPFPEWVVQHDAAIDTELGVLKTGKEADAFLIERALPEDLCTGADGEATLMVAKRYRTPEHAAFHRSASYTEGRRTKDSREARAMAKGSAFGKEVAAAHWARAEFDVLSHLWRAGLAVPYPVQIVGTEVLMEFIGADGAAGPRLQATRPDPERATDWAEQLHSFVLDLAGLGLAHGDLSPYNVLVDPRGPDQHLVVIDVPQVTDLIANTNGPAFLHRDCVNVCTWLRGQGVEPDLCDPEQWYREAMERV
jgi:RIO kinase 1